VDATVKCWQAVSDFLSTLHKAWAKPVVPNRGAAASQVPFTILKRAAS